MHRQLPLLLITSLACSSPEAPAPKPSADEPAPKPRAEAAEDDVESRGAEAGLTAAQSRQLAAYGFGAVVPRLSAGWRLASFTDETYADAVTYPAYVLRYVHADGRCFELMAASEGLGDVFVIEPPHLEEAEVPGIATFGPVPLGWSGPDETGDWGPNRLSTEWFGTDGLFVKLGGAADDSCTSISAGTARQMLASLRYLDPEDDEAPAGHWEFVDAVAPSDMRPATDRPEAHALAAFGSDGEGTSNSAQTLRAGPHPQVILVTSEALADDSIRDQRTRVVYMRDLDGGWAPQMAGRQQRCHAGRGHQDWSPEPCL